LEDLGGYMCLISRAYRFSAERRVSCRLTITVPVLVQYEGLHVASDVYPKFPSPRINDRSRLEAHKALTLHKYNLTRPLRGLH
jgi:hypothetical protein